MHTHALCSVCKQSCALDSCGFRVPKIPTMFMRLALQPTCCRTRAYAGDEKGKLKKYFSRNKASFFFFFFWRKSHFFYRLRAPRLFPINKFSMRRILSIDLFLSPTTRPIFFLSRKLVKRWLVVNARDKSTALFLRVIPRN